MQLVLGVDGGGTKTRAVLVDARGNLLGSCDGGPSNLQNVGEDGVRRVLRAVIEGTVRKAGTKIEAVGAIAMGAGGLDTDHDRRAYDRILDDLLPAGVQRVLVNDAIIALYSGTRGAPGVVIVAGTGSIVAGHDARGNEVRVGGWGYLGGDEGSAFDIGRSGLAAALQAEDGRGEFTLMGDLLCRRYGVDSVRNLLPMIHSYSTPQRLIASLALVVDEAAVQGDRLARSILKRAAGELIRAASTGLGRLGLTGADARVVLVGGVFCSDLVRSAVMEGMRERVPGVQVVVPEVEPVAGAVMIALRQLGRVLDDEVYRNLTLWASSPMNPVDKEEEVRTAGSRQAPSHRDGIVGHHTLG
ncbi:N-acetylglucosamine kinase [Limnochorda pilosa]|uniref:ATPase BadF/BadG/BcrA/BcrD type domain-containing protein n=1 Tax=Limnochorda pilosa TaxID=1555112 RepID=A0A0K2SHG2_LIMPI|nr:BadF/BadG/BcrA/BcrD ATPase family protein [Limnochorda pilosa]BAS26254.1 hypothetical protein LIP_0397 [Limnochorda pilosa]